MRRGLTASEPCVRLKAMRYKAYHVSETQWHYNKTQPQIINALCAWPCRHQAILWLKTLAGYVTVEKEEKMLCVRIVTEWLHDSVSPKIINTYL